MLREERSQSTRSILNKIKCVSILYRLYSSKVEEGDNQLNSIKSKLTRHR